jgi:hypothetical protein
MHPYVVVGRDGSRRFKKLRAACATCVHLGINDYKVIDDRVITGTARSGFLSREKILAEAAKVLTDGELWIDEPQQDLSDLSCA